MALLDPASLTAPRPLAGLGIWLRDLLPGRVGHRHGATLACGPDKASLVSAEIARLATYGSWEALRDDLRRRSRNRQAA